MGGRSKRGMNMRSSNLGLKHLIWKILKFLKFSSTAFCFCFFHLHSKFEQPRDKRTSFLWEIWRFPICYIFIYKKSINSLKVVKIFFFLLFSAILHKCCPKCNFTSKVSSYESSALELSKKSYISIKWILTVCSPENVGSVVRRNFFFKLGNLLRGLFLESKETCIFPLRVNLFHRI